MIRNGDSQSSYNKVCKLSEEAGFRNGERISPGFWARDFGTKQGTKTGVMLSRGVGLGPYGEVNEDFCEEV
jgi:hypothetical protein